MARQAPARRERSAAARADDFERVMRHHRAAWRVERLAWTVGALLLGATVLGVFGDGPLSRTAAGSTRALSVEYDRLLRSSAPAEYRFRAHPSIASAGVIHLRLDQNLVDQMELESITPAPEHQRAGPGYTEFTFLTAPGAIPLTIDFRYRPATFGRHVGRASVAGSRAVRIEQFVYP